MPWSRPSDGSREIDRCHQNSGTSFELKNILYLYPQPDGISPSPRAPQQRRAEPTLQHQWLRHRARAERRRVGLVSHLRRAKEALLTASAERQERLSGETLSLGEALAADGRVVLLQTRGRRTGDPLTVAVGFVEEPGGSLLVAAGSAEAQWSRNLLVHPHLTATWGLRSGRFQAVPLEADSFNGAIQALILRYGTPAERLGRGPAFRLVPQPADEAGPEGEP